MTNTSWVAEVRRGLPVKSSGTPSPGISLPLPSQGSQRGLSVAPFARAVDLMLTTLQQVITAPPNVTDPVDLIMRLAAAAPTGPVPGQFFYNTTASRVEIWTGSAWVSADNAQTIQVNNVLVGSQPILNLVAGANITLAGVNDTGNGRVNVTVMASGGPAGTSRVVIIEDAPSLATFVAFVALGGVTIGFLTATAPALPNNFTIPSNSTVILMGERGTARWSPSTTTTVGINAQLVLDGLAITYAPTTVSDPMFQLLSSLGNASGAVFMKNVLLTSSTATGTLFQSDTDNTGAGVTAVQAISVEDSSITHTGSFALSAIPNGFTGTVRIVNSSVVIGARFEIPGVGGYTFNGGPGNSIVLGSRLFAKQFRLGSNNQGRGVEALGSTFTVFNDDADPSLSNPGIDFQTDNQPSTYKQCKFDFQYPSATYGALTYIQPLGYTTLVSDIPVSFEDCSIAYVTGLGLGNNVGLDLVLQGQHLRTQAPRDPATNFDSITLRLGGVLVDSVTGCSGGGTGPYTIDGVAGGQERRWTNCRIEGVFAFTAGQTAISKCVLLLLGTSVIFGIHYFEDVVIEGFLVDLDVQFSSTPA